MAEFEYYVRGYLQTYGNVHQLLSDGPTFSMTITNKKISRNVFCILLGAENANCRNFTGLNRNVMFDESTLLYEL